MTDASPHPFRRLQPADHVVKVLRRSRYRMIGRPEQLGGTFPDSMRVLWRILAPDGKIWHLTFEKRTGVHGKGASCYRIVGIEPGKAQPAQPRRQSPRPVSPEVKAKMEEFVREVKRGGQ